MPGSGVLVNVIAVLIGTGIGLVFGHLISERFRVIAFSGIGLATIVIGGSMAIGGLTGLGETDLGPYAALVVVGSLVGGALIGEALRIEHALERFGRMLERQAARTPFMAPTRTDQSDENAHTLVEGFVTASLLFCVGAMAILGSIADGLGDPSLLYLKALLDGVAAVALASTLGVGVGLSALPVLILQGAIALGASSVEAFVTDAVIYAIKAAGGALILAIGLDLAGIKRLPVGNMLPAIAIAIVLTMVLT